MTRIIRDLLRAQGARGPMWTNKYERCRTVKCYAPARGMLGAELFARDLVHQMQQHGLTGEVRVNHARSQDVPSIIVRLPLA
jgi:hypothetical protein